MDTHPTPAPISPAVAARVARRRRTATPNPVDEYCNAVRQEVARIAGRNNRPFDVDDIAQAVVARFMEDPVGNMTDQPDPVRYARTRATNAGYDHSRREAGQRGEGVRRLRKATSLGDRAVGSAPSNRGTGLLGDPADLVVGRVAAEQILVCVDDDVDRAILSQHAFTGDRVTEIAIDRNLSHPTVSRKIGKARQALRPVVMRDEYVSAS